MYRRTLFLSAHFCSNDVPAAGHRLAAAMLAELAAGSGHVDLVTFRTAADRTKGARLAEFANVTAHVFDVTTSAKLKGMLRHPTLPIAAAIRKSLARDAVAGLLARNDYDRIFVDFTQTLALLPPARLGEAVVRVHDVLTQLYERQRRLSSGIRKIIGQIEYARTKGWEPRTLAGVREILTLNEKDVALLASMTGRSDVRVLAPTGYYVVEGRSEATIKLGMILFWGNMGRQENVDAVEHFIADILPTIAANIPVAHLVVGGANPPQKLVDAHAPGVTFTGFVESPDELFRACQLGIAPLRQGAGIKIKTLEFIASGIPTVATTVGAEGISPHPLLFVEDDVTAFADKCVELLEPPRAG